MGTYTMSNIQVVQYCSLPIHKMYFEWFKYYITQMNIL